MTAHTVGGSGTDAVLYGRYLHTLDDKGRVSLPAKFRAELGDRVFITEGLDKCLFLWSAKEFEIRMERLGELPQNQKEARDFSRLFLSGSVEVEVDSHGRILLPEMMRQYAGLEREVMIIGVAKRAEIWDRQAYEEFRARANNEYSDLAGKLVDLRL